MSSLLYLDIAPNHPVQFRKLAGVRRYASLRGWDVVGVPRGETAPAEVRDLLARLRPAGVVVEGSGRRNVFPPRLFGRVPVSYVEYPEEETAGRAPNVSIDDGAVADAAFHELSLGKPPAFAVLGHKTPHLWSSLRVRAFRDRCARAGVPCFVFPAVAMEPRERYEARLADWLASLPPHAAVFAAGDSAGVAVSRVARIARRRIPGDLTLCSTCDIPEVCEDAPTPVTSIHIDFERMGWLAAKALESRENASAGPLFVARRQSTAGRGRREPWILRAVEIIRAEACAGLTVDTLVGRLAREVASGAAGARRPSAVSRRNFDRRFREAMGHSALEEILSVRLAAVCELLLHTNAPVMSIADFCGFGTHAALDTLFRQRFNMSMGAWRTKNKF